LGHSSPLKLDFTSFPRSPAPGRRYIFERTWRVIRTSRKPVKHFESRSRGSLALSGIPCELSQKVASPNSCKVQIICNLCDVLSYCCYGR
jgi:hypothetical protein